MNKKIIRIIIEPISVLLFGIFGILIVLISDLFVIGLFLVVIGRHIILNKLNSHTNENAHKTVEVKK